MDYWNLEVQATSGKIFWCKLCQWSLFFLIYGLFTVSNYCKKCFQTSKLLFIIYDIHTNMRQLIHGFQTYILMWKINIQSKPTHSHFWCSISYDLWFIIYDYYLFILVWQCSNINTCTRNDVLNFTCRQVIFWYYMILLFLVFSFN